jgi:hypothetical protein
MGARCGRLLGPKGRVRHGLARRPSRAMHRSVLLAVGAAVVAGETALPTGRGSLRIPSPSRPAAQVAGPTAEHRPTALRALDDHRHVLRTARAPQPVFNGADMPGRAWSATTSRRVPPHGLADRAAFVGELRWPPPTCTKTAQPSADEPTSDLVGPWAIRPRRHTMNRSSDSPLTGFLRCLVCTSAKAWGTIGAIFAEKSRPAASPIYR